MDAFGQSGAEYIQAIGNAINRSGGHGPIIQAQTAPLPDTARPSKPSDYKYLLIAGLVILGMSGLLWYVSSK